MYLDIENLIYCLLHSRPPSLAYHTFEMLDACADQSVQSDQYVAMALAPAYTVIYITTGSQRRLRS